MFSQLCCFLQSLLYILGDINLLELQQFISLFEGHVSRSLSTFFLDLTCLLPEVKEKQTRCAISALKFGPWS